jgi:hypothetical protein
MLIRKKLPPGSLYPQLIHFPADYFDFLAVFSGGQTVDMNTHLTTGSSLQTAMYRIAVANEHLRQQGNPIQGEFLVDIFLTEKGTEAIILTGPIFCTKWSVSVTPC